MQTFRARAMYLWFGLRKRWTRFFFEPVEPRNLGLCRVLFFGAFFLFYLPQDFSAWGYVGDSFFDPIVLFEILRLPVLSSDLLVIVQGVWKVSLALSCLGLFTRVSTISSLTLGVYLLGLENNFGKVHENETLVVISIGILALSRCGDAYSIDRLISRWRQGSNPTQGHPRISGDYTWPVRAVWVVFALTFFAAGVSKLRHSGLEWIFSDNMAISLITAQYHNSNLDPLTSWGLYLAQHAWLLHLVAAGTIVLEVSYPLALFSSKARWVIVPSVFFMLVGVRLLLGPTFDQFLICHLFWVPWERVSRHRLIEGFQDVLLRLRKLPKTLRRTS
jgi:hypothetical protein